jgi:predicted DCC family thiol-disulfide oxidoreductase YuxK
MVFLFDGDCAFCTSSANYLRRIVKGKVSIEPYQFADLTKLGLDAADCEKAVQYIRANGIYSGSVAIAKALVDARNLWSLAGWIMQVPVISSAAFLVYEWVSKNRHKLPGGTPACQIPTDR